MRSLDPLTCDVLVIGHGASGLYSAWKLAKKGMHVIVCGRGTPATALSSGCINLLEAGQSRKMIKDSVNLWLEGQDCDLVGDERVELVSHVGHFYPTDLAPRHSRLTIKAIMGSRVAVCGIEGNDDIRPNLVRAWLNEVAGIDVQVKLLGSPAKQGRMSSANTATVPLIGDNDWLVDELSSIDADYVLVSPLFPYGRYREGMTSLRKRSGRIIIEAITPLSLPGSRLHRSMLESTKDHGVHLLLGTEVMGIEVEGDRARRAKVRSGRRDRDIIFDHLVWAGGSLIGGGLDVQGQKVFDMLGVFDTGESVRGLDLLEDVCSMGITTDNRGHPSSHGSVQSNVHVVGSALPHMDYPSGKGIGACLLSAHQVVEEVLGVGR